MSTQTPAQTATCHHVIRHATTPAERVRAVENLASARAAGDSSYVVLALAALGECSHVPAPVAADVQACTKAACWNQGNGRECWTTTRTDGVVLYELESLDRAVAALTAETWTEEQTLSWC